MFLGPRIRPARNRLAGIVQIYVALVQQEKNPSLMRQVHNPLQVLRAHHGPCRIRRRIQNDRLGLRRNRLLNRVRRDAEVLFLAGLEETPPCRPHIE